MVSPDIIDRLRRARVVPVIREPDPDTALSAGRLLAEAGAGALEITFTTPEADAVLKTLKAEFPDLPIGAGTLLTAAEATAALLAAADFHVSPCWSDPVAQEISAAGRPYMPGAVTPGEVWHHWQQGAAVVKVFPAHAAGGPGFVKSLKAVFPDIPLMPTGGVSTSDADHYLAAGALCVGMGGTLIPSADLATGHLDRARDTVRAALAALTSTHQKKEVS